MISRTVRSLVHVFAGLGAGLAIIIMLVAWQLSQGPISLAFLSSTIEDAVNREQHKFRLRMRDTILTWAGWERALDIRVIGVEILTPKGVLVGSVPEVSFSISGRALLGGHVAPETIELFAPRLRFQRLVDGSLDVGFGEAQVGGEAVDLSLFKELFAEQRAGHPLNFLSRIDIVGADVTIDDRMLGTSWNAPSADLRLTRDSIGVQGRLSMIVDVDGRQTELEMMGRYRIADNRLDVTTSFENAALAPFAVILDELEPLKMFKLPLKGRLSVSMPLDGAPDTVWFDLEGGEGDLALPEPAGVTIRIKSAAVKGRYVGSSLLTEIEELRLDFGENGTLDLPAPINHLMPTKSIVLAGRFEGRTGRLEVSRLDADLHGPRATLTAAATNLNQAGETAAIELDGSLTGVLLDDFARYWPKALGADPHRWTTTHLSDGMMREATVKLRARLSENMELVVDKLTGTMDLADVTVDYLPPMAPAKGVNGEVTFNQKEFDIRVKGGTANGLKIDTGRILLTGLDKVDQFADIRLIIEGSVPDKLAFIDQKPLGFASELGIDPEKTVGSSLTDLKLHFILENDLTHEQVKASAKSELKDVSLAKVFMGRGVHDSDLDLKVDNNGMTVTGDVIFEAIPAKLVWRENFGDKVPYRSRYDLSAVIDDVTTIADLGLDMEPFSGDFVSGSVGASIRFTVFDEIDRRLEVTADITDARLAAPAFGWRKEAGVGGRAQVILDLEHDTVADIPLFTVKAADLVVKGSAKYAGDGTGLTRVDFDRVAYGRTELAGALIPKTDGGWEAGFHGPSFDLSPLWEDIISGGPKEAGKEFLLPDLTLAIEMGRVWLTETESFRDVSGTFSYRNEIWETVLLDSTLNGTTAFNMAIAPGADGDRQLAIDSDNAGETLELLGFYDNMVGGRLQVRGVYDDAAPDQPLHGTINVTDFRIVDAPVLARVISIMALTGILEALEGEGLVFDSLDVPFTLDQGTVRLKDAKAAGVSLGFTASGNIYTNADVVDVEGTVVPAYAINSAFGRIPLLGDLLTGGEKGSGVFAANYSMTGSLDEPSVTVNPLSALTPGILRNVFDLFGEGKKPADEPELFPESEGPTIITP